MAAIPGQLDARVADSSRRSEVRRKVHLEARGTTGSDQTSLVVLDISTTGLLLQTTGDLGVGDMIELQLPDLPGVNAVVKWSSSGLFGCEFPVPASSAFVSAALLRSPPQPPIPGLLSGPDLDGLYAEDRSQVGKLPGVVRVSLLFGLVLASWAAIVALVIG